MLTSFQQTNGSCKNFQTLSFRLIYFSFSYGVKMGDTLNVLRRSKFIQMLSTSSLVDPSNLLLAEGTAYYHALRVYLQVAQLMNLDLECLDPPAPDFLLNFIG